MEAVIAAVVVLLALTVLVSALAGTAKLATILVARRGRPATPAPSMDMAGAET